jgi:hypothetical protein
MADGRIRNTEDRIPKAEVVRNRDDWDFLGKKKANLHSVFAKQSQFPRRRK